jgi:E3 ubiquitin-protein ligase UBR1
MSASMTPILDHKLGKALRDLPYKFSNRYHEDARHALLEMLFRALTNDRPDYLSALFPAGFPKSYKLKDAQGKTERAEYTEAARGHPCGHIFKQGEATYHCMTCTDDATCVLCSRCFDASDHEGHQFHISASAGNSGCCDCGDLEAWKRPVKCAIHTASEETKKEQPSPLPLDFSQSIRTTVARVLDYFCDVISCSPEQLRLPKTQESIRHDESFSRLGRKWYAGGDEYEAVPEYCLLVWNDEKHTVVEVRDVIKRACRKTTGFGMAKAYETDDVGRSILRYSTDLKELIKMSETVDSIKVTTTIRTSRDTFREQMCGTIVGWLSDISGCSVVDDHHILRYTICEEMLKQWRVGSEAYNAQIGRSGIDDHAYHETAHRHSTIPAFMEPGIAPDVTDDGEDNEQDMGEPGAEAEGDTVEVEVMGARRRLAEMHREFELMIDNDPPEGPAPTNGTVDVDMASPHEDSEEGEAERSRHPDNHEYQHEPHVFTPTESDNQDTELMSEDLTVNYQNIPQTPYGRRRYLRGPQPSHWAIQSSGPAARSNVPVYEDLTKNIRLDSMILFDMRLWKKTRIDLRDLYISTVVNVPAFKRILGLRFSGLYTSLSQLYLIADREPDHSIINLSLQMLTSPSITEEVIERGNFLTNLMAILYTFLTTRQVGFPHDVSSSATLAFDSGSVTNRRLYHFFTDLRYFLSSEPVQRKVREERQYLLQFIDLVKLSQGICPNVRAVGDHVEYETEAWISASLLTREINKLCRQFSESFSATNSKGKVGEGIASVIYTSAFATIVNSVGLERSRFDETEIKEVAKFKQLRPFAFEMIANLGGGNNAHRVIDFVVEKGSLSFHHALHYTLSWLVEGGKSLSSTELRNILYQAGSSFIKQYGPLKRSAVEGFYEPEDALLAMYDFPLRVCAWLSQMKAGLWVRNGMSLRHQMSQYKGVSFRDVAYHRDIFLLQTAFVTCNPSRLLATMIDRYGLEQWIQGIYVAPGGCEPSQMVDILEDFVYLLIMILGDRASLITIEDEPNPLLAAARKDIIHALCFKPLSFSDLNNKLNEKVQDYPDLHRVLTEMTMFRPPEGLTDSGTFELKDEYLEALDPYNTNYSKNQRDEAENIYKEWMSQKTGKPPEEIVLEPKLRSITTGAYCGLSALIKSPIFVQIIFYALRYALVAKRVTPNVPVTRVESLLHVILQLTLIGALEDNISEREYSETLFSFIYCALTSKAPDQPQGHETIIEMLQLISNVGGYASCRPKIKHILKLFYRKRTYGFNRATAHLDFPFGRLDTPSPANVDHGLEAKKKQALERNAQVMAQFQQQQKNFMDSQGVSDWPDDDLSDTDTEAPATSEKKVWKYPTGVCILCQEETNHGRIYGTFAMLTESNILRQTNLEDAGRVREAMTTPTSLDHSIDDIRPFGVSGENHQQVVRLTAEGEVLAADRQGLGKGWPSGFVKKSPVSSGCGHLMHSGCFDHYFRSVVRRHAQQIARHHPERTENNEFVCPLCKALGNAFLPILWKEKEESYPGVLACEGTLETFLDAEAYRVLPVQRTIEQSSLEVARNAPKSFSTSFTAGFADAMRKAVSIGRLIPPASLPPSSATELAYIFSRIADTINVNWLNRVQLSPSTVQYIAYIDVLISLLGSSVSAVEIAQRGIAVDPGTTLLNRTSAQTVSHLRILSDTINSYISIGPLKSSSEDLPTTQKRLFRQLFVRSASALSNDNGSSFNASAASGPLLLQDIFDIFVQSCLVLAPTLEVDVHNILRLCYLSQIVQIVMAYMYSSEGLTDLMAEVGNEQLRSPPMSPASVSEVDALSALTKWMSETIYSAGYLPGKLDSRSEQALVALVRSYSLTFLRKATIFLHVSYGVDFPPSSHFEAPELDRLSRLLNLPDLFDIISDFRPYSGKQSIKEQVSGWILALAKHQYGKQLDEGNDIARKSSPGFEDPFIEHQVGPLVINLSRNMALPHPAPFELIGLPKYFDVLMEEANRRRCPTTGKELTDPALCLFCGAIFCSQAVCCIKNKIGPANLHVEKFVRPRVPLFVTYLVQTPSSPFLSPPLRSSNMTAR